jgi:hypothetical protein
MVAAMLGTPLMEWQQHVADVLLEIDPDTGELWYTDWTLTVPRQSGKSTLILAKASHRCSATGFFGAGQQIAYTAQTQKDAAAKFAKEYQTAVNRAPRLRAQVRANNERSDIRYPNGSMFGVNSTTEKAGHGSVLDEAYVDEAFSQVDSRVETAVEPAMATRRNRQLGTVSTAGWSDASPYLLAKVQAGRALVALQLANMWHRIRSAFFEWSAPDDADHSDENVWLACMPAVHRRECPDGCTRHTIRLSFIRGVYGKAVRENKLAEFCRSYLNQWKPKPREGEETALGNWLACAREVRVSDAPVPTGLALAVSRERDWTSIGASGLLEDGTPFVAPVVRLDGTESAPAWAARLSVQYDLPVVVDVKGAAGEALAEAVEAAGGRAKRAGLEDYVTACADLFDRVQGKRVAQSGETDLRDQVTGARWRPVGDGRRVFGRRNSEGDIDTLEAVTWALWASADNYDVLDSFH